MKKIVSVGMATIIAALNFGCSAFRDSTQRIEVTCNPQDAVLMINGQRYQSPATLNVRRDREVSINCSKEGMMPYQRIVEKHFSTAGVLDIAGTVVFFVPGVGLLCAGAWDLDETNVNINLVEKEGPEVLALENKTSCDDLNSQAVAKPNQQGEVSMASLKVVDYSYDSKTQKGRISVDISAYGIGARDWVIKNIGKICSSKELLMEAGHESSSGGHYRLLNESMKDGVLTIEFVAGYSDSQ
jgi:hypothetical protein